MEVKSTGSSKVVVDLTKFQDIYAYGRLVRDNKPFDIRVEDMSINKNMLTVTCILGRTENPESIDKNAGHPELPGMVGDGVI